MWRATIFWALLIFAVPARAQVKTGLDVLVESEFRQLQGKKVGLITNQTGKAKDGRTTAQLFAISSSVTLTALFSPEHGFAGGLEDTAIASDTLKLPDGRDIPIYSLYGATLAPTASMLSGLDALVFDIQDIGARFYTYSTTMAMAMEAAAANNLDFFVLDRPNPVTGDIVEGPVLQPDIKHFVAYLPVPTRHGLTMGELARLHNTLNKVGARLTVVALRGWTRDQWYEDTGLPWTKPSPNMPNVDSAILYPGVACLEYSNLSVGRGTPTPFRWVGAPWLAADAVVAAMRKAKLPGLTFEAQDYTPEKGPYKGTLCHGVSMTITDRRKARALNVFAHLVCAIRDHNGKDFKLNWEESRRLIGTDKFLKLYQKKYGAAKMIKLFNKGAEPFTSSRTAFLLY